MVLKLQKVTKHFGGLPAVNDVSFDVDEGEIVALVGPNGAGKSTLLKAISGLQPPSSGSIKLDGVELAGMSAHQTRKAGIAMVMQTPRWFDSLTVRDNVIVGSIFGTPGGRQREAVAKARADEALGFVGLAHHADDPVGTLNLHEKRFLEMARAIAGHPRLLLLDEVMAGLNDTELQASIDIVRRVKDELGVTVIWVEHVMTAVMRLAERIVVLDFGQLLADGEPADVMRKPEVVTAYLGRSLADESPADDRPMVEHPAEGDES